jgi:ElaB/YqjD/DUF883 family membrane-anchored ribosome-binding protein
MDQAAREGGPAVSAIPEQDREKTSEQDREKTPEEIRADIDETREQLGDTAEALAAKTDVKAQAKDRVAQVKHTAQQKKDAFTSRARAATPDSAGAGAEQIASTVKSRPLPFGAVAVFAAGVLVGWSVGRR